MAASNARIANQAWEALFRAQATIRGELAAADAWGELAPHEYGVLYALSRARDGLRPTDLTEDVLLSQPGMSRLVARLQARGLVQRVDDPDDARARRIRLTAAGADAQRRAGWAHGRQVALAMTRRLDREKLCQLRDLCRQLTGPELGEPPERREPLEPLEPGEPPELGEPHDRDRGGPELAAVS